MRALAKSMFLALMCFVLLPQLALADVVLAARTLRARTILTADDLILRKSEIDGAVTEVSQLIGLEARFVLYEGRVIDLSDVGPAAIIERNQIVTLVYANGQLRISADGRALGRAGAGEGLKVMNLTSRKIVTGLVGSSGAVFVGAGALGVNE